MKDLTLVRRNIVNFNNSDVISLMVPGCEANKEFMTGCSTLDLGTDGSGLKTAFPEYQNTVIPLHEAKLAHGH